MGRLVPSTVRRAIEELYPAVEAETAQRNAAVLQLGRHIVRGIVDLIDAIPVELITLDDVDYAKFCTNRSMLRTAAEEGLADRSIASSATTFMTLSGYSPIREIYGLLALCPDQSPTADTTGLEFIGDQQLRQDLRTDISAATSALHNHEYKAATVLAGAVVEALLLWALLPRGAAHSRTAAAATGVELSRTAARAHLDQWPLGDLIKAAVACKLITAETATAATLAQNFRNLIHPGKAGRLAMNCTLGTAYSALAAVQLVASDLAARGAP